MTIIKSESIQDTKTATETACTSKTNTQKHPSASAKVSILLLNRDRKATIATVMILFKTSSKILCSAREKTTTDNRLRKPRWTSTSLSPNKVSPPQISLSQRTTRNPHLGCIRPKLLVLKGLTLTKNLRPKLLWTWNPSLRWDSLKLSTWWTIPECKWPSKTETPRTFPQAPTNPRKTKYSTSLQSGRSNKKGRQKRKVTVLMSHLHF